jgi:hypothetical protein
MTGILLVSAVVSDFSQSRAQVHMITSALKLLICRMREKTTIKEIIII